MTDKMREEYNEWYAKEIGVLGTKQHKQWFKPWEASRACFKTIVMQPIVEAIVQSAVKSVVSDVAIHVDAARYRYLMSPAVYNGTLGVADGRIDFEFKDEAQEAIDAEMLKQVKPC